MKKLIILTAILSFEASATEVTTLTVNKAIANEMSLVSTDERFLTAMEKYFIARTCKLRIGQNSNVPIKEISFATICRAEVIKYLLDYGHKPDHFFLTFTK